MRPVEKGSTPQGNNFSDYRDFYPDLHSRIGSYCSYCERRIPTNLAIEHIQPKSLSKYQHLVNDWNNFILACVNCNSTKGNQDVQLADYLLPDRDNTAHAYEYLEDGVIKVAENLGNENHAMAVNTLELTGLDKPNDQIHNSNGEFVYVDRVGQRMEARLIAIESKQDLLINDSDGFRIQVVKTALGYGFFSIWMNVFKDDKDMRIRFIKAFPGTSEECYDNDTKTISPRLSNHLPDSGKV